MDLSDREAAAAAVVWALSVFMGIAVLVKLWWAEMLIQ